MQLSSDQLRRYRAGLQQKLKHQQEAQLQKQQRGWEVARQAAQILKSRWGASKVILFGSMLEAKKVHDRSDIDLAVWGLSPDDYFRTLSELLDLDPEFAIDLVEIEQAKPLIRQAIQAGVEL
ncbi:MAG: nucleotidyltransferase domain-containing protein [Leptolyngbyaceae cyanobacterium HOT.MB2.61]|jgi:predicted nucleotidyltransferase|nr:nucleotidyltransferase domain-containing protein [Leptolyngbyaceae cyanobacterium HOT.MB2.61]